MPSREDCPLLYRFMTVDPSTSSLAYEAQIAIKLGLVQQGEDMAARRVRELEALLQEVDDAFKTEADDETTT